MDVAPTSGHFVNKNITPDFGKMTSCCRVCMSQNTKMLQIFDAHPDNVIERILFCTGIKMAQEDGFPNEICNTCFDNLSVAHQFKTSCLLADETFRKVIKERIKVEKCDEDDDFDDRLYYTSENEIKVENDVVEVLKPNNVRIKRNRLKSKSDNKLDIKIKPSRTRKKLTQNNNNSTEKSKPQWQCDTCDIKFASKEQFSQHRKDMHNKEETWMCEICGKVFVHRGSHYTHVRSHMPPKYGCEQCDYKTWHKHDLVKHVRIHTGVKLYQCESCTASYYTSSNLSCHIRRFHQGIKRFKCHLCDRSFYDRTKLNRHIDSHNDIKRYECDVCHACFSRRCYWKKHLSRLHGVVIPAQRPGRQKVNLQIGDLTTSELGKTLGVV